MSRIINSQEKESLKLRVGNFVILLKRYKILKWKYIRSYYACDDYS